MSLEPAALDADPREGPLGRLTPAELLALVLEGAAHEAAPPRLARLDATELLRLSRASCARIARETGLPPRAAERCAAAFEFGRRLEEIRWRAEDSVRTPAGVYRLMAPKMRGLERETLFVLSLDGRHRVTGCHRVSEGTLTMSLVHPREVFAVAIREAAAAIIVAHNHPSGDPEPSPQDLEVTRRLADAGRLLGIPLLDHVVVGHGAHTSLRERLGL